MAGTTEGAVPLLEGLYGRHRASAVQWAERNLSNRALAEDAVQEAFVQIFIAASTGVLVITDSGAALVQRNTLWAAHKLRGREQSMAAREQQSAVSGLDEDSEWIRHEAREMVAQISEGLSRCHREVLYLRYVQGYPDAACAQLLGIGVKALRSRRRRALVEARKLVRSDSQRGQSASMSTKQRDGRNDGVATALLPAST